MTGLFRTLVLSCSVLALCSCGGYHIRGTVDNEALEGAKIYLVPMFVQDFTPEMIDSTYIKNLKFSFRGKEEHAADLRIERPRREGVQHLFIITEPGLTNVVIGADSRSWGTPQNDSIQVYKELCIKHSMECTQLYREGRFRENDSVHFAIMDRIKQLMRNTGGTTLCNFLISTNPDLADQLSKEEGWYEIKR